MTLQVCTYFFKMAQSLKSFDSVDSGSELSEFDDVEPLNNAAVQIVPWRFEPRGRPWDERLHFERENEESVDRDDRQRNTDWWVFFGICKFTWLTAWLFNMSVWSKIKRTLYLCISVSWSLWQVKPQRSIAKTVSYLCNICTVSRSFMQLSTKTI